MLFRLRSLCAFTVPPLEMSLTFCVRFVFAVAASFLYHFSGKLECNTCVACTNLEGKVHQNFGYNLETKKKKKKKFFHIMRLLKLTMQWTRNWTRHFIGVETIEANAQFMAALRCYNVELVLSPKDCWLSTDSAFREQTNPTTGMFNYEM